MKRILIPTMLIIVLCSMAIAQTPSGVTRGRQWWPFDDSINVVGVAGVFSDTSIKINSGYFSFATYALRVANKDGAADSVKFHVVALGSLDNSNWVRFDSTRFFRKGDTSQTVWIVDTIMFNHTSLWNSQDYKGMRFPYMKFLTAAADSADIGDTLVIVSRCVFFTQ
jgi:hypothetical protein